MKMNRQWMYDDRRLIRLKRIYNFWWFHAVILSTLDVLFTFYIFFRTNLLIQCQVRVPVFCVFLTLFRSDFGTESKRNKIPKMIFSRTEEDQETWGPSKWAHSEPTSPISAASSEAATTGLVGSLWAPCLVPQASRSSSVLEKNISGFVFR